MGLKLKIPFSWLAGLKKATMFFLYSVACAMVGALCLLHIQQTMLVDTVREKSWQMEQDLDKCSRAVQIYIKDRDIIMKQFADMEARFTRMEHMMHIPRAERHGAWKAMVEDQ